MRYIVFGMLLTCVPTPSPIRAQEPDQWAVVIGINDYLVFDGIENGDLRGAEHDALLIERALITRFSVPESNILTLLSRDATKSAIEAAVTEWLPERVRPQDRVFFYFAGHGAQSMDDDGDESDGLDETISPADVELYTSSKDIRDDELRGWLAALRTSDIIVILDSCHSGTATRAAVGYVRTRSLPGRGLIPSEPQVRSVGSEDRATQTMTDGVGVIEIAAAAPGQYAVDVGFRNERGEHQFYGGAFTTFFVAELEKASPDATFEEVFQSTFHAMKASRFEQDPQISGPVTRALFPSTSEVQAGTDVQSGEQAIEPPHVSSVGDGRVLVEGRTPDGLAPGDILETPTGALIRIEEVFADQAVAIPLLGAPAVGEALIAATVDLPTGSLLVRADSLSSSDFQELRSLADTVDDLRITRAADTTADLLLRYSDDLDWIEIIGRDGGVRFSASGDAGPASIDHLFGVLMNELALEQIAAIENPRQPFAVELTVHGARTEFADGDPVVFRVRSERSGYLTLIDLGTNGTVTVLFPNPWIQSSEIPANVEVRIPDETMHFDFQASLPSGRGLVKAIVTEVPLELPSYPSQFLSSEAGAQLARGIRAALEGATTSVRDIKVVPKEGQILSGSWASALTTYRVR